MKRLTFLLLLLIAAFTPAPKTYAIGPQLFTQSGISIIGRGCTTAFYIDAMCKPCGVGMKSSGSYPVVTGTLPTNGTAPFWTFGDSPDPDPKDSTVCTVAQWQTKWGSGNSGMVTFLNQEKGFTNTGNIYYLSQSGSDTTGTVNSPTLPYATMAKIMAALQATTAGFSGTGTLTSGSNVLTINTASSGTLTRTAAVAGTHIPSGTFIIAQLSGTAGGVGSYLMTSNASGTVSTPEAVTGAYQNGGVVVIRGGTWTTSAIRFSPISPNPSWQLSGSYGHPLLIMAYPGETVLDEYQDGGQSAMSITGAYPPGKASCCLIVDGIQFSAPSFDTGQGLNFANYEDLTVQNSELAGWNDILVGQNSKNIKFINNVFHEIAHHAIYISFGDTALNPNFASGQCAQPPPQDFNFAQDQRSFLSGASCGAIYQVREIGNLLYNGGTSGFDLLHTNAWVDYTVETGNIVSFSGGSAFDLQSGNYNTIVTGNLGFDVGSECFEEYLGGSNVPNGSATHRWNSFTHNVCYQIDPSLFVWGAQSGPAVIQESGISPNTTSLTNGSAQINVTAHGGPSALSPFQILFGTGIPSGATLEPYGTGGTTGTGATGTYVMSLAATGGGTITMTAKNPLGNAISDTVVANNVIVVTDNGGAIGTGDTNSIPFDFEYNSYPETDTITGNTFWSAGSSSHRMMYVSTDSSTLSNVGPGAYIVFSGGTGCNSSTGSFSNCFPGNTYASSNPFANASSAIYQTPGAFNFGKYNLK